MVFTKLNQPEMIRESCCRYLHKTKISNCLQVSLSITLQKTGSCFKINKRSYSGFTIPEYFENTVPVKIQNQDYDIRNPQINITKGHIFCLGNELDHIG